MRLQKDFFLTFSITIFLLILGEIFTSTVFPLVGLQFFRLHFNILLVLYLCFKQDHPILPIAIFIIQYVHSFFTIEGWAIGTFAGVAIGMVVGRLKDTIHLSSYTITVFFMQVFQLLWFGFTSLLAYLKFNRADVLVDRFWQYLPESVCLSFISPQLFNLLDKLWRPKNPEGVYGANS